ncbi:HYC_CC_PP family protein [Aquimarina litoralis]|uniref:HYC_CC_PP family protein n=1 Tax=Aquimarina litoralis TaxID=584605 RepID=UPI003D20FF0B
MKQIFKKISSLLLACLVLMSTLSFTVGKHYCGRFLVDVSVYAKPKKCGMDMLNHSEKQVGEIIQKSCCKDEIIVVEGQNELKNSLDPIEYTNQLFLVSYLYSLSSLFSLDEERKLIPKEYSPPERVQDIQILYETFLI